MSLQNATRPAELVNAVAKVDQTFLFIFGASAVILVLLTAAMVWFVIRYNRKRHPVPATFSSNFWAEVVWTVLPTILVMGMFWSGWVSYRALRDAPPDSLETKVMARMWSWDFEYPGGKHSGTLVVPVGRPVKLAMTSADVLHGFFAPAFRMKIDTVPGMTTYGWFRADKEGEYVIFCSVYCGLQHAKMLSAIRAVSAEEYERFLAEPAAGAGHPGKALLDSKGCLGCHSLDGSDIAGPTFKGMFGRKGLAKGGGLVDRAYVEAVLKDPAARLGKASVMPAYPQLTAAEREAIMKLLESEGTVPGQAPGQAPGKPVGVAAPDHSAHEKGGHQ